MKLKKILGLTAAIAAIATMSAASAASTKLCTTNDAVDILKCVAGLASASSCNPALICGETPIVADAVEVLKYTADMPCRFTAVAVEADEIEEIAVLALAEVADCGDCDTDCEQAPCVTDCEQAPCVTDCETIPDWDWDSILSGNPIPDYYRGCNPNLDCGNVIVISGGCCR